MSQQPSSSSQASSGRLPTTKVTPINLQNYRPQAPINHHQNLCFIPSPSTSSSSRNDVATISRIMATPIMVSSTSSQHPTSSTKSHSRKRKEEAPSTTINYAKDYLCYECGEFFTDVAAFEDHKSYHSFAKIALRMHVEQQRKDVEAPEFEMPLKCKKGDVLG